MKVMKIIGTILGVSFILALGGAYLYFSSLEPQGEMVFMTLPDQPVELRVDGGETITIGGKALRHLELSTGQHTVEILSPTAMTMQVEVPRFDDVVVPVVPEQCFALFDASFMYASDYGNKGELRFIRLWQPEGGFTTATGVYHSRDELPKKADSLQKTELLVTNSCEVLEGLAARVERN